MKKIIVANWKMNPRTQKEAKQLFEAVKKGLKNTKNAEVVICPPFVYLTLLKGLTLGAQNVSSQEIGFTGGVSTSQLKDLDVEYVIVGHSERRRYVNETNELINKKIKAALSVKLKPIFCVGENEGEDKQQILERQIKEGLAEVSNVNGQLSNVVIAYEPVWAIGTGKNCSYDETMSSVLLIRKTISSLYSKALASKIKII